MRWNLDERVETGDRLLHQFLVRLLGADVLGHQDRGATLGLDHLLDLLGVGLLGRQVADRDIGALSGKGDCGGAADARVAARDQGLLASQTATADVALLTVVGGRVEQAGEAGPVLLLCGDGIHAGGVDVHAATLGSRPGVRQRFLAGRDGQQFVVTQAWPNAPCSTHHMAAWVRRVTPILR